MIGQSILWHQKVALVSIYTLCMPFHSRLVCWHCLHMPNARKKKQSPTNAPIRNAFSVYI